MQSIELLVKLKIPDVTALTAAGALRRRMGYSETLKSLTRADYYRLELNVASEDEAQALATELAEKTNMFVNPNKHVYELRTGDQPAGSSGNGVHAVRVLVTDPADGSAQGALAALQGRLGYGESVSGLLKGVLWTLAIVAESREQAVGIARDIALTTAREHGLLMNPHFQECEIG